MRIRQPAFVGTETPKTVRIDSHTVADAAIEWLLDSEIRQMSPRTLESRRDVTGRLISWASGAGHDAIGSGELRRYMAHLSIREPRLAAATIVHHHSVLRTFFRWIVAEELAPASPFEPISAPVCRDNQVRPFTDDEIALILAAARRAMFPDRDYALVLMLLDTGMRVGEMCELRDRDMDISKRRCYVVGKGDKARLICFGASAAKALWRYYRMHDRAPSDPVFAAERGRGLGSPLTRSGVYQLVRDLVRAAGITRNHIGPHTLRHTFAVTFLRQGGDVLTLRERLGHTDLSMTNRYVAFAAADIERQSQQHSPGDKFAGRNR